ncbi:MAG: hypothetical protein HA495_00440 [Thaumarchaeota archaeon]|nr:hypothetical protein [Nitrososphaerota archaeon]
MKLKGFIVSVHAPSEQLLYAKVDTTSLSGEKYFNFVRSLQTKLAFIDYTYSETAERLRGRGVGARFLKKFSFSSTKRSRITEDKKVLIFNPFPSRYANILKYLRIRLYTFLNNEALSLTLRTAGRYREKLYIVTEKKVSTVVSFVEKQNKELGELEKNIVAYTNSSGYKEVLEILSKFNISCDYFQFPGELKVKLDLIPVNFDYAIEEWSRKDESVAKILREKQQEIVKNAVMQFYERIKPILMYEEGKTKINKKLAVANLKKMQEFAEELGLKSLNATVINPLITSLESPAFNSRLTAAEAKSRIDALINSL